MLTPRRRFAAAEQMSSSVMSGKDIRKRLSSLEHAHDSEQVPTDAQANSTTALSQTARTHPPLQCNIVQTLASSSYRLPLRTIQIGEQHHHEFVKSMNSAVNVRRSHARSVRVPTTPRPIAHAGSLRPALLSSSTPSF